jgi:hypothetical protein
MREVALMVLGLYGCLVMTIGSAAHQDGYRGAWRYAVVGGATVLLATIALGVR